LGVGATREGHSVRRLLLILVLVLVLLRLGRLLVLLLDHAR